MLFTQNEAQRGERNRDFVTQVDAATDRANGDGKAGIQYQIDEAQKPGHLAGDTIGRGARNLVGAIPSPLNIEGATGLAESIIDGAKGTPSPEKPQN